ncbi:MAG: radical SAM-associated putative lipoprotein [Bacteroides sp.]|nr:radical SAM-associated putative lipoprotein [Bacteroides sp.]
MRKDEYGTPYAEHEIKGRVVDPEKSSLPVQGIRVIVKPADEATSWANEPDTLFTDRQGEFYVERVGFKLVEKYRICYEEIVKEENSPYYKKDSVEVETSIPLEEGKGWYKGRSAAEVNIELRRKEVEE